MLQTTSLTRGTFIQRATNLFRAAWAPCLKKYAWKIPWERESFNFTFTSTKYLSRYYVYKRTYHFSQNNNHPRIMPRFLNPFFFLFLDAYCVYAKRKILGHCRRRRCCKKLSSVITKRWDAAFCIVSRRETDTFVPRLRFLIIPVREKDALWKMIKNIVYT